MRDPEVIDVHSDGLKRRITAVVDAAAVDAEVDTRLEKLRRTAEIKGFRRGRAPRNVVAARHGRQVREAVVDRVAIAVARSLIVDHALAPVGRPRVEVIEDAPDAGLRLVLTLEVAPEVALGSLDGLQVCRLNAREPGLEAHTWADVKRQLFDQLIARYDFPVPEAMVAAEYERIAAGFESEVGETIDAELRAELVAIAERRIRLAILLAEIGRVHGIGISREEIEALIAREGEGGYEDDIVRYYLDNPTALAELQSRVFEDRVVEFLLERTEVEERTVSAEELMAAMGTP